MVAYPRQEIRETVDTGVELTLPYDRGGPPDFGEFSQNACILVHGATELLGPELRVGGGHGGSLATVPVPETAVDKHREPIPNKNHVRRPR